MAIADPPTFPEHNRPIAPTGCRSDRRWILVFAALVMAVTSIPYLIGYSRQGNDWRFSGFLFGVEDGNSYIAKMLRGSNGDWLFRTPYNPLPQRGVLVYLPYILLGKLSAPPGQHEQLVSLYHLFRLSAGVGLIFATYDFVAIFLREKNWRRLSTALAVLGGGLGWLSVVGGHGLWNGELPLDFYSPEAFGFLMLFGLPHLAGARALVLWGLRDYLSPPGGDLTARIICKTGLIWIGAGLLQPIYIMVAWAVLSAHVGLTCAWQFWRLRSGHTPDWSTWRGFLRRALIIGLLSAPLMLYTFASFKLDPVLRNWEVQNRLYSPSFNQYLLVYIMLIPLAILGGKILLRNQPWQGCLVVGWAVLLSLLVYLPVGVQRRLAEGTWVAIVILSMRWMENTGPVIRRWGLGWISLSFLTPLLLFSGSLLSVWNPDIPLYRPVEEVKAFQYLASSARPGEVVLASYQASNPLPAWAPLQTLTGHGPEGLNPPQVERFFTTTMADTERIELLDKFHVSYVFWGPDERALGSWDPREVSYLDPIYEVGPYLLLHRIIRP